MIWLRRMIVKPIHATERDLLQHELEQIHAQAVKDDRKHRALIRWELQIEDRRNAIVRGIE